MLLRSLLGPKTSHDVHLVVLKYRSKRKRQLTPADFATRVAKGRADDLLILTQHVLDNYSWGELHKYISYNDSPPRRSLDNAPNIPRNYSINTPKSFV